MYEPHPALTAPENPDTVIWRYLSLAKFLDMLERQALRFTQLDSLRDPFEGIPAEVNLEAERRANEAIRAILAEAARTSGSPIRDWQHEPSAVSNRRITYINCWHMNDYESMAMWQAYSSEGLAIRSTFRRLADCFQGSSQWVGIGKVIYRDRRDATAAESMQNMLNPAMRKGMSYAHESELRAITLYVPEPYDPTEALPTGINIGPINLDVLIEG